MRQASHAMPAKPATPFVKLVRHADTLALLDNHPHAFLLLTRVAMLASRSSSHASSLQPGQVILSSSAIPGLSRQQFRTALNVLIANQQVTSQATNAGHIVTLCGTDIYDINLTCQQPTGQPTCNQRVLNFDTPYSIYRQEGQEKREKHIAHASDPGGSKDAGDLADQSVVASHAGDDQPVSSGPASPTSPNAFDIFWAIFPNKVGREIAVQEWNRLGLDEPGYQDVVCKLRGHIDSRDYFSVTDSRFRKAPGPYLRDRRYDDIDDQTRPYRRTYEQVARWTVERGWLTAEQAGLDLADHADQAGQPGPAIANHRLQA